MKLDKASSNILSRFADRPEMSVEDALQMVCADPSGPHDFYPLALLVEAKLLGLTYNISVPEGAENMREYAVAKSLYIETLPRSKDGSVTYDGCTVDGSSMLNEKIYMKANGFLYLNDKREAAKERYLSFALGVLASLITFVVTELLLTQPNMTMDNFNRDVSPSTSSPHQQTINDQQDR
ncbi:MAG TPA: hypothetical protein VJ929_01200 [Roseovarius sp.]|nr:hypothetical protein [Roseovarius sp.]